MKWVAFAQELELNLRLNAAKNYAVGSTLYRLENGKT